MSQSINISSFGDLGAAGYSRGQAQPATPATQATQVAAYRTPAPDVFARGPVGPELVSRTTSVAGPGVALESDGTLLLAHFRGLGLEVDRFDPIGAAGEPADGATIVAELGGLELRFVRRGNELIAAENNPTADELRAALEQPVDPRDEFDAGLAGQVEREAAAQDAGAAATAETVEVTVEDAGDVDRWIEELVEFEAATGDDVETTEPTPPEEVLENADTEALPGYAGGEIELRTEGGATALVYTGTNGNQHTVTAGEQDGATILIDRETRNGRLVAERFITAGEPRGDPALRATPPPLRGTDRDSSRAPREREPRGDPALRATPPPLRGTDRDSSRAPREREPRGDPALRATPPPLRGTDRDSSRAPREREPRGTIQRTGTFDAAGRLQEGQTVIFQEGGQPVVLRGRFDERGQLVDGTFRSGEGGRAGTVRTERGADGSTTRTQTLEEGALRSEVREVRDAGGALRSRTMSQTNPETGARTSVETRFRGESMSRQTITQTDSDGRTIAMTDSTYDDRGLRQLARRSYDAEGKEVRAEVFERRDTGWVRQVQVPDGTFLHQIAGDIEIVNGEPVQRGLTAHAVYSGGRTVGFSLDLAGLASLGRDERLAALRGYFGEPLVRGLAPYQPRVHALGFHGASAVRDNAEALVGFTDMMFELAQQRGARPSFFMGMDEKIYVELRDEKGNLLPAGRFMAELGGAGVPGERGGNVKVYALDEQGLSGQLGTIIYGPDRRFFATSETRETNWVTGTDLGSFFNTLSGIRQHEHRSFIESTRDSSGTWRQGRTIAGGATLTYTASGLGGQIWSAIPKAGESIVSSAGAGVSALMGLGLTVHDRVSRLFEGVIGAAIDRYADLTGDRATAEAYASMVAQRRWMASSQIDDLLARSSANLRLNPLVAGLIYGPEAGAAMRASERRYLFNAPRELVRAAQASEGATRTALLATALAAQVSLDFLSGVASFGPLGLAAGASPALSRAFHVAMMGMMAHGAGEATFGEHGIIEALGRYMRTGTPESELELVRAISAFSNTVLPLAGGLVAARAGRRTAANDGSVSPAHASGELPPMTPELWARFRAAVESRGIRIETDNAGLLAAMDAMAGYKRAGGGQPGTILKRPGVEVLSEMEAFHEAYHAYRDHVRGFARENLTRAEWLAEEVRAHEWTALIGQARGWPAQWIRVNRQLAAAYNRRLQQLLQQGESAGGVSTAVNPSSVRPPRVPGQPVYRYESGNFVVRDFANGALVMSPRRHLRDNGAFYDTNGQLRPFQTAPRQLVGTDGKPLVNLENVAVVEGHGNAFSLADLGPRALARSIAEAVADANANRPANRQIRYVLLSSCNMGNMRMLIGGKTYAQVLQAEMQAAFRAQGIEVGNGMTVLASDRPGALYTDGTHKVGGKFVEARFVPAREQRPGIDLRDPMWLIPLAPVAGAGLSKVLADLLEHERKK